MKPLKASHQQQDTYVRPHEQEHAERDGDDPVRAMRGRTASHQRCCAGSTLVLSVFWVFRCSDSIGRRLIPKTSGRDSGDRCLLTGVTQAINDAAREPLRACASFASSPLSARDRTEVMMYSDWGGHKTVFKTAWKTL